MSTTPPSARVSWLREARAIMHLAVPLALAQLAYMAIMTTDVVMMGWLGPDALAAGALAGHFQPWREGGRVLARRPAPEPGAGPDGECWNGGFEAGTLHHSFPGP